VEQLCRIDGNVCFSVRTQYPEAEKGGIMTPQTKSTMFANDNLEKILNYWFVQYNPLYFISVLCFLFGVYLVSTGLNKIQFIEGQIFLTLTIEVYEILLLSGSFILYRTARTSRAAVILGIMEISFLFDCSFQTEQLSSIQNTGIGWSIFWIIMVIIKINLLIWIFRLRVPLIARIIPVLGAAAIAIAPYILSFSNINKNLFHLYFSWFGVILAFIVIWFRMAILCKDDLSEWGKTVLLRCTTAAWMIWGGFYFYHLISLGVFFNIHLTSAHIAPFCIIIPFFFDEEKYIWGSLILSVLFSLAQPPVFWFACLCSLIVFVLKGWKIRKYTLYIGAVLSFYFLCLTIFWQKYPFPEPELWLNIVTGLLMLFIGWRYRLLSALLFAGVGILIFLISRGRHYTLIQWGIFFISVGFIAMIFGIFLNWKQRDTHDDKLPEGNNPVRDN
jgi:hypothetical protein